MLRSVFRLGERDDDGTVAGRKAAMGALSLYLDFINMFMMLLRLSVLRPLANDDTLVNLFR